jgi:glyoxylase-like metal-dependent hydrolase (beta-lactamase superfamily II)
VVLVDDKFEVDHDGIMAELKKVTSQPVKYVINTHHHGDHSGGNAKLQAMGVQVVASEQARQNRVDAKQAGQPNVAIDRRAHIYLGGKTAEVFYFVRSHTNGYVFLLFPAQRTLAAGDMFTYGDATPQLIDYPGGGSAKEWTSTLDGALQLDFDTVVPGHGTVTTKQELRKFRDSTLAVRNAVHDMIVDKKSKDEVWKMLRTGSTGRVSGRDHRRHDGRVALRRFRGESVDPQIQITERCGCRRAAADGDRADGVSVWPSN